MKNALRDLKDAVAAKLGIAKASDTPEWPYRYIDAQQEWIDQLTRLLDQHLPDWRKGVTFPAGPPCPSDCAAEARGPRQRANC
jgi:hypothetical protein